MLHALLNNAFQFHKGTIKTLPKARICGVVRYFNSIKVRLKPSLQFYLYTLLYFNSIKVRLKLKLLPVLTLLLVNFNSIKVRLKLLFVHLVFTVFLFQFHKGTIKTCKILLYIITAIAFQFHKGTIKTRYVATGKLLNALFQFHKGTIKTCALRR